MKRNSKKNKNIKKNKIENNGEKILFSLFLMIYSLIVLFNFGFLGSILTNITRLFLGNTYLFFASFTLIYSVISIFSSKNYKKFINFLTIEYLIILEIISNIVYWNSKGNYFSLFFELFKRDFLTLKTDYNLGGGIIGLLIFYPLDFLLGKIGSLIISILVLIIIFLYWMKLPLIEWIKEKIEALKENKTNFEQSVPENNDHEKERELVVEDDPELSTFDQNNNLNNSVKEESNFEINLPSDSDKNKEIIVSSGENTLALERGNYKLPSVNLLVDLPKTDQKEEFKNLKTKSSILKKTLLNFNIKSEIAKVSLGPSVTQYEIKPQDGVKVSKIVNLSDDIALALSAKSIRVEAPIPGKPYVGVEIPNDRQSIVGFKDLFNANDDLNKKSSKDAMKVPLGKNITGDIVEADLTSLPHLLIAGSTGSGKSVAINGIITSILLKGRPDQVRLLMIDPKKVELSVYNNIPHLISPVVSNPVKASLSLQKIVKEMEERYELFAKYGIRNIDGFNENVKELNEKNNEKIKEMPYVVVIIDELADLMMTVSNEVEPAIIRIAQMGRAAGIHLVLATQRPSVDVITGLIKANVPSRIAFAVSSGIDSRTILDKIGAEKLLGKGDMLFSPLGKPMQRVQGSLITDVDVEQVVANIKKNSGSKYISEMNISDNDVTIKKNEELSIASEEKDELWDQVIIFIVKEKKASISLIQRKFRIGYNRAARIIDMLEEEKLIGPSDGSKQRDVYVDKINSQ